MAAERKTSKKRPAKPFKGAADGVPFSTDNQPSSESKKEGWKEFRARRMLTQQIIAEMTGADGKNLKDYVNSLLINAKMGNAKAIETINKCLEDDIIKIAHTDGEGNDIDYSKYTDDELRTIAALQAKGRTGEA